MLSVEVTTLTKVVVTTTRPMRGRMYTSTSDISVTGSAKWRSCHKSTGKDFLDLPFFSMTIFSDARHEGTRIVLVSIRLVCTGFQRVVPCTCHFHVPCGARSIRGSTRSSPSPDDDSSRSPRDPFCLCTQQGALRMDLECPNQDTLDEIRKGPLFQRWVTHIQANRWA